jgi:hypothetical protein
MLGRCLSVRRLSAEIKSSKFKPYGVKKERKIMFKVINSSEFVNAFEKMNRGDNFTVSGRRALFEHLEDYEESTDEKVELDVIALCCDYAQYESAWDAMEAYQPDNMPVEGEEGDDLFEIQAKNEAAALEWLQNKTIVMDFDGGVIIQNF